MERQAWVPRPARPDEHAAVLALIVAEQQRPERCSPTLGEEAEGVRAELDDLAPPWVETVRLVTDEVGNLAGAALADWDLEVGRAWIHGPWVTGDDRRWEQVAARLVEAMLAQVPAAAVRREMTGHLANRRLADLAARLGWEAGEPSHVLEADRARIAAWPDEGGALWVRPARPSDLAAIAPLHDEQFPATYATAEQLVAGAATDAHVTLVAEGEGGRFLGYVAGRVQPGGEGFIDFVVVDPAGRRRGVGRRLVVEASRRLVARSTTGTVCLVVHDHRAPARALYASLGFRRLLSIVGYRAPSPPGG